MTANESSFSALPDWAVLAGELMSVRRTVLPKRLQHPGPDADQLDALWQAVAAAPDHGQLLPWRWVLIPEGQRPALAGVFEQALVERDPQATAEQRAQACEKAFRAPFLALVVVDGGCGDVQVPLLERVLSAGCGVQNFLLLATAQGLGSALTSGKALQSQVLRQRFGLAPAEHALCFVSVGTAAQAARVKDRPLPAAFVSTWGG